MSNIVVFTNNGTQYYKSVNTQDHEGVDAIVNPDLSNVDGVSIKYWKRDGDNVVEMTQAEKDAVDAQELDNRKSQADNYSINMKTALTALVKVINKRLTANKITKSELIEALKSEIK